MHTNCNPSKKKMYKSQTCNWRGYSDPCIWGRGWCRLILRSLTLQSPGPTCITVSLEQSRGNAMDYYKEHSYDDNYNMVGEEARELR